MAGPLVSVVIPTYNRAALLDECLRSLTRSTYPELDIVVVDDVSKDDTAAVMEGWTARDPRVRFEPMPANAGAPAARNRGLALAKGEFLNFLDSDDLLHPAKFEIQLAEHARGEAVDLVACQTALFSDDPSRAQTVMNRLDPPYLDRFLQSDIVWHTSAPLWRTDFLRRIGGFKEGLPSSQDYELHTRALIRGARARTVPQILNFYRTHEGERISQKDPFRPYRVMGDVFESFLPLLAEEGKLNDLTRTYVAGDFLWLGLFLAERRKVADGLRQAMRAVSAAPAKDRAWYRFRAVPYVALVGGLRRFAPRAPEALRRPGLKLDNKLWYQTMPPLDPALVPPGL